MTSPDRLILHIELQMWQNSPGNSRSIVFCPALLTMKLPVIKYLLILSLTELSMSTGYALEIPFVTTAYHINEVWQGGEEDSMGGVAAAINRQAETPLAKITAIYSWIGHNIQYDTRQASIVETPHSLAILVREVFTSRKAICQGYSALFSEFCRRCNIPSFIVHGIAKMNGLIQKTSHAWVAANVDNKWYLFDPAWGAGYIQDHTFSPNFTTEYFMIDPEVSIKSRVPFDPIWQLLDHPYSLEEFKSGRRLKEPGSLYAFADSIAVYLSLDEESKLVAESRRLREYRMDSKLMSGYYDMLRANLNILRMSLEVSRKNQIVAGYNMAVSLFNKAVTSYNSFGLAKNAHFKGFETADDKVLLLIQEPDSLLSQSEKILTVLKPDDQNLGKILGDLAINMSDLRSAINADKLFVEKYCKTAKTDRIALFYGSARER